MNHDELEAKLDEFRAEIDELLSRYWEVLASPDPDLEHEVLDSADVGGAAELYAEAWALVVCAGKIAEADTPRLMMRWNPKGQNPILTGSILMDTGRACLGW